MARVRSYRLAIVVVSTILLGGCGGSTSQDDVDPGGTNESAGVTYTDWDGNSASTVQFEGKPLVVNFWASWCTSCLHEIPAFVKLYESYDGKIAFLGLNLQDDPATAADMKRELGITYAVGRDPQGEAFRSVGGVAMPTTVLIGPDGQVVERLDGEVSADELADRITALFSVKV